MLCDGASCWVIKISMQIGHGHSTKHQKMQFVDFRCSGFGVHEKCLGRNIIEVALGVDALRVFEDPDGGGCRSSDVRNEGIVQ